MNYAQKYYDEIFEQMLNDSLEKGLISHAEDFKAYISNKEDISNYYVMDKSVIAEMVALIYEDITRVYESHKVEYAEGSDLDDIGKIVGIERPPATSSETEVTFTLSSLSEELEDLTLPEGIIISTEDNIQYITLDTLYFTLDKLSSTVQCRSIEKGTDTKVLENKLTHIISDVDYPLTCTNSNASSGGVEEYTDDEYRYFLMNWIKILLKGSEEAYEYYFAKFEGIDGYKLVPNWDGSGTMKIILDPGTSYQLNKAYGELQSTVTQATEDIVMFAPVDKNIDIYAIVNVDIDLINPYSDIEKEEIKNRIITAIKIFIDGGYRADGKYYPGLNIGEDFIPHKLAVFVDEEIPELKNIEFNYPETYISITDEEKGKTNTINIEMI